MRLHKIAPEYRGQVRLVERAFPLEVYGGGPPNRSELEQEMWLAAIQEPEAEFKPFGDEWPATTLPAFQAAWAAAQQGEAAAHDMDLRIRRAFFAEARNIGRGDVVTELAREAGLDMLRFARDFASSQARDAVLAEGGLGKEKYGVSGTPTAMLTDGTRLELPQVEPQMQDGRVVSAGRLPCCGEECYAATRRLFDEALKREPM